VVVPRYALTSGAANGEAAGVTQTLTRFLQEQVGSDTLCSLFGAIAAADTADRRPRLKPRVVKSEVVRVMESSHPYVSEDETDDFVTVSIPGATSITVAFDPSCRTEAGADYVEFLTVDDYSVQVEGSERFSGREDGERNWPGCEGCEPLVIQGSSFVLHFHAGSYRDGDWSTDPTRYYGWKFTATGACEERTSPPRRPALPSLALLRHVKAPAWRH